MKIQENSPTQENESKFSAARKPSLRDKILQFDTFAVPFQFKLPEGKESNSSVIGCCFTFFLVCACVFYGVIQMIELQ